MSSGSATIRSNRRQWLVGLLVVPWLVFQTASILHDLDIAAHASDADCEICDLFVFANHDIDAVGPAIDADGVGTAIVIPSRGSVAANGGREKRRPIRAPPLLS